MTQAEVRRYQTRARSTETFGRVLVSARDQHLIVDGPVENGCPGEAVTPAELFLSGVASCGIELVEVLADRQHIPLKSLGVTVSGMIDRSRPVRADFSLFNRVGLEFFLKGVTREQGEELIETFKGR